MRTDWIVISGVPCSGKTTIINRLKDGKIQVQGNSMEIANSEVARKFYLGEKFKL